MHGRFYHRACFQSMWRGGFEGEGRYYSPLGACPLQRGRRRTAGRLRAWTLPGPGNPNERERRCVQEDHRGEGSEQA